MQNQLSLSREFIAGYLEAQGVEPCRFEVPLPLGFRHGVSLDPRQIQFEGEALTIPLKPDNLPALRLRITGLTMRDQILWFTVDDLKLGALKIQLAGLVRGLVGLFVPEAGPLKKEGREFGIELNRILADRQQPLRITSIRIDDGVLVGFELAE